MKKQAASPSSPPAQAGLFALLKPYLRFIVALIAVTLVLGALNLSLPKLIARGIDQFATTHLVSLGLMITFAVIVLCISGFIYLQSFLQTYTAERVAKELRENIIAKLSRQDQVYMQSVGSSSLLTNLTSDVDAVKVFISMAISSLISSAFLIIGASILLLTINWKLALAVLTILPIIAGTFSLVFSRIGLLFKKAQGILDTLNKLINESVLGAALIRVLNAQTQEYSLFMQANNDARNNGLGILRLFSSVIPVITFVASLASVIILGLGGRFLILGQLTLGEMAAFSSYVSALIFPIIMIGFMSSLIGRATASYQRISTVLTAPEPAAVGTRVTPLRGDIQVDHLSFSVGEHAILKNVSFSIKAGSKTAIIGPTAAGKTQLLSMMSGLLKPNEGTVLYDGHPLSEYEPIKLHEQVGFVFQESIVFNLPIRENIAFSQQVDATAMEKAIETAELTDFIKTLPDGLDTVISERGTSLSGGQKQRVMLARALALKPRILFLDDFTARIDRETEGRILTKLAQNYPDLTLISVTQKIASVEAYDQIILLMEGELIAQGTHTELMDRSSEYLQILQSQQSTHHYEGNAE